jgi:RNA polymerase sigma-70 factor (ECF subfamily)
MSQEPFRPASAGPADAVETTVPASGHAEAVRRLFQEHNRALLGFLFGKLDSEAEAHEVAQEAYVRLLQLQQPGAVGFLRGYLFRIAGNLAVDRLRHRQVCDRNSPQRLFEELLERPSPERTAMSQQEFELLLAALEELPRACREACALHFFADRTLTDIARQMGLTRRCIHNYIVRGLEHCRQRLGRAS